MHSLPRSSGVYKITCLATNKAYIGSSANMYQRWIQHLSLLRKGTHYNRYLQASWNKYRAAEFSVEVIEEVAPGQCYEREAWWIEYYRTDDRLCGFNIAPSVNGGFRGEEAQLKLNQIRRSSEWRQGQSENAMRQWAEPGRREAQSNRSRALMTDPVRSIPILAALNSPEAQAKSREKQRGKKIPQHTIDAVRLSRSKEFIVVDPEGCIYRFYNLTQFCKDHGLSYSAMHKVSQGKARSHKGWKCELADA